jgi:Polysaccharide pyruvyl transferase
MLYGAIGFSYDNFAHTRRVFDRTGLHSANLGDNMQSLAVRHLYRQLGVPEERIVRIDRDTLRSYDGPPVVLPMNAVFRANCLPVSPKITPLWIGFHADEATIRARRPWLETQGLIGCRDPATAEALKAQGISAEVTGCLTFSLPARRKAPDPDKGRVLIVMGKGPGALPTEALQALPSDLLSRAEFILQRREMTTLPLTADEMAANDLVARQLLHRYHRTALLIVTPLHHAAAPAIAAGIPTVVVRREASVRFGFLQSLVPVHLAPDLSAVNWRPDAVDTQAVKARQMEKFRALLAPWL